MAEEHPRRELEVIADGLESAAEIAFYFAGLANQAGDAEAEEENAIDGETFKRWEQFLRDVKDDIPFHREMKDGS